MRDENVPGGAFGMKRILLCIAQQAKESVREGRRSTEGGERGTGEKRVERRPTNHCKHIQRR